MERQSGSPNHLFLCFFLTITSPLLASGESSCRNPYPGLVRMARGVDITTLDLFPTNLLSANGFGRTLFEFSCKGGNTWAHPENGDLAFDVPDQVAGLNSLPSGALIVRTDFEQSLKQLKGWLAANVGLDVGSGLFGSFSASSSYRESQEQIMKSNKSLAETSATITTTQVDFKFGDQMKLSEDFLEYVDNRLPAAYEDDPAAYDGFIASFGTHYFETGHFGGFLYQKTAIESEYLSSTDEQEISVNLEASFKSKLGIKGGFEKGKEDVRESLKAKSRSTFYYYGGRTDLSDTAGGDKDDEDSSNKNRVDFLREWQPTLLKDPWLLSGKLKPIELLVRNGTIRPQVAKAVAVRRARAHLDDLKRSVRLGGVRLSADDRKELEMIERLLKSPKAVSTEQLLRYGGEGVEALLERVQKIRAQQQLGQAYEKTTYIRDLRNCIMGAASNCDHVLFLSIARKYGQPLTSLTDRLYRALFGPEADRLKSDELLYLLSEAGRLFYAVEHMTVDVPRARYQCVRNIVDRNTECQRTNRERGHKFKINSV